MICRIYHPVWELPKKPEDSVTTFGPIKQLPVPRPEINFRLLDLRDKTLKAKLEYALNKHIWPTT